MSAETLFDQFLATRERGDEPDVAALLDEAGAEREALGRMIDRYLRIAPVRSPSEIEMLTVRAKMNGTTVLTEARVARKLTVDDVVGTLETELSVPAGLRAKLRKAYQELEQGRLDLAQVSQRALAAVQRALGVDPASGPGAPTVATDTVFLRAAARAEPRVEPPAATHPAPASEGPDEVDRLFYGGYAG